MDQSPDEIRGARSFERGQGDLTRRSATATRRGDNNHDTRTPQEILDQIEQTMADISETIDAIQVKLSPDRLKHRAKEMVREATIGRVERTVEDTVERAESALHNAGETARGVSCIIVEMVRQNPVPSALVGIGLGWLALNAVSPRQGRRVRHAMEVQDKCVVSTREMTG